MKDTTIQVKASVKGIRIAPRKVRLVAQLIRGLNATVAEEKLLFVAKKASDPVRKLLLSAIANAENNKKIDRKNLKVKSVLVDEGVTMKRWSQRAMGRASQILKKSSNVVIILEAKETEKPVVKKEKVEKAKEEKKEIKKVAKKDSVKEMKKSATKQVKTKTK